MSFKDIEDRIKSYESLEDRKFIKGLPIVIRFDGKNFSSFCSSLIGQHKPYDIRLTNLMNECCLFITRYTNSIIGYTGSDEITIVLYVDDFEKSQVEYDGRIQKLLSVLASKLSVRFNYLLPKYLPEMVEKVAQNEDKEPVFDAKAFVTPTLEEACNCLLVREQSVYRNAISMAAQAYFSHKELHGVNGKEKQEMLFNKFGINFNDYPVDFKRGRYVKKITTKSKYTSEELEELHPKHHARQNPDMVIERSVFKLIDMPIFSNIENRVGYVFKNEDIILRQ